MNKLIWYLKQLLPLTYWSVYQEEDKESGLYKKYFTIWRMWFGKVFDAITIEANDYYVGGKAKSI